MTIPTHLTAETKVQISTYENKPIIIEFDKWILNFAWEKNLNFVHYPSNWEMAIHIYRSTRKKKKMKTKERACEHL